MSSIFVDSIGLLALWNASDPWHRTAVEAFFPLSDGKTALVTSTFVLIECGNVASVTPFRDDAGLARERFEETGNLITPTQSDWDEAWRAYRRGGAGIMDHVSFVVMRRLGITVAFTNAKHFRTAGFETMY